MKWPNLGVVGLKTSFLKLVHDFDWKSIPATRKQKISGFAKYLSWGSHRDFPRFLLIIELWMGFGGFDSMIFRLDGAGLCGV